MPRALQDEFGIVLSVDEFKSFQKIAPEYLENHMRQHGAAFVSGFGLDLQEFIEFTSRFDYEYMEYIGGGAQREINNNDKTVLTATGAEEPGTSVELHGEQHYQKSKPDRLFFFCKTPAMVGGETTVCDGIQLYQRIPDSYKKLFEARRIKYTYTTADGIWQSIYNCKTEHELIAFMEAKRKDAPDSFAYKFDSKTRNVVTSYCVFAVNKSNFTNDLAFVNNLIAYRFMDCYQPGNGKPAFFEFSFEDGAPLTEKMMSEIFEISKPITCGLKWKSGDFVLIDNSRIMHGRRPYDGKDRKVIVRMAKDKSAMLHRAVRGGS